MWKLKFFVWVYWGSSESRREECGFCSSLFQRWSARQAWADSQGSWRALASANYVMGCRGWPHATWLESQRWSECRPVFYILAGLIDWIGRFVHFSLDGCGLCLIDALFRMRLVEMVRHVSLDEWGVGKWVWRGPCWEGCIIEKILEGVRFVAHIQTRRDIIGTKIGSILCNCVMQRQQNIACRQRSTQSSQCHWFLGSSEHHRDTKEKIYVFALIWVCNWIYSG